MSTPLITIKDTNSLIDALEIMNAHNFRILPVTNSKQKLVEILADKDIFKIILRNKDLLSIYYNNKKIEPSNSKTKSVTSKQGLKKKLNEFGDDDSL